MSDSPPRIEGGCHCGAVRFVVRTSARKALNCNCSICRKTGYVHLIVAGDELEILQGEEALTEYRFNARTACHLFCSTYGTHPFYVLRSHPGGFSVNVRCLDDPWPKQFEVTPFDVARWEASIDHLR